MRPPRVYVRSNHFYIRIWNNQINDYDPPKSTGIECEIKPPASIAKNPTWWKKSKNRELLEPIVDEMAKLRHDLKYWKQSENARIRNLSLLDLEKRYNDESERLAALPGEDALASRHNAVLFVLKYDPKASTRSFADERFVLGLKRWAIEQKYKTDTINAYFRRIKKMLDIAVKHGIIPVNTLIGVKAVQEHQPLTGPPTQIFEGIEVEIQKFDFLYTIRKDLYDQLLYLRLTGVRIKDSTKILKSQINLEDKLVYGYNYKKHRNDLFPISDALHNHLKQVNTSSGEFLFANREPRRVGDEVFSLLKKIGIKSRVHILKKNYGNELKALRPPADIMELLMHHLPTSALRVAYEHYLQPPIEEMREYLNKAHSTVWEPYTLARLRAQNRDKG